LNKNSTDDRSISLVDSQLKELTSRLDAIIRLQCALLPDTVKQRDKIRLLSQSGLSSNDIAGIMGIKSSTVRGVLSRAKGTEVDESTEQGSASQVEETAETQQMTK
jgi:DNA-directed RNA polymerase specialized sigma24 family protein